MDKRVKELWVGALRSEQYPQGREALRTETGYCCLGVLCNLFRLDGHPEAEWLADGSFTLGEGNSELGVDPVEYCETLPPPVAEWAGLGKVVDPELGDALASHHNDGIANITPPKTFARIADLVEKYL